MAKIYKPLDLPVLYEDNHLLAVNKPYGMLAQGDDSGDFSMVDWVTEYIRVKYQKPGNVYAAICHRIDRPVGGVLLFAKTGKAAARVSEMFRNREIQKTYLAICEKTPEIHETQITHWLKKQAGTNVVKAFNKPGHGALEAVLNYKVLKVVSGKTLMLVEPKTGRPHQIRSQLSKIGSTIAGDVKYGKTEFLPDQSIALFAYALSFNHPTTKKPIMIQAPVPKTQIWSLFPKESYKL